MNSAFVKFLTDEVLVQREYRADDESGQSIQSWRFVTVDPNDEESEPLVYKCSLQPLSASRVLAYNGLGINAQYEAFFLKGADVVFGDKLIFGAETYYVQQIVKIFQHHIEVLLKQETEIAVQD